MRVIPKKNILYLLYYLYIMYSFIYIFMYKLANIFNVKEIFYFGISPKIKTKNILFYICMCVFSNGWPKIQLCRTYGKTNL